MKQAILGCIGFVGVLFSLTVFGSVGFYSLAFLYVLSLYLLFFGSHEFLGYSFLVGLTLGVELMGTSHLGEAALIGLLTGVYYQVFGKQLRFTSRFLRYIVALLFTILTYSLLLYSYQTFLLRIIPTLTTFLSAGLISYLFFSFNHTPDNEFV